MVIDEPVRLNGYRLPRVDVKDSQHKNEDFVD